MHFTATFRAPPPLLAAGVQHFSLDDDEPPAAGSRPDRLSRESSSEFFLDKLLVLFGYPDRSAAALLAGGLPLR